MTQTPIIKKARIEDFEDVFPLLLDFNNPLIKKDDWKNLLNNYWGFQPDFCGYKMIFEGNVVGFIAYILSKKYIKNQWQKFCNISSWIVKPEFRCYSLDLLYPLQQLKDYNIVSYTPSPGAFKVETKLFKFKVFERSEFIIPIIPKPSLVFRKKHKILIDHQSSSQDFEDFLPEYDKKVFQDHAKFNCQHVIFSTAKGNLYMIFKKTKRKRLPYFKLYYVNNSGLLIQNFEEIRFRIPLALKGIGLIVDSRFLVNLNIPFKKIDQFLTPMIYKSAHLQPIDIDYLYSEFFLLDFKP